MPAQRKEKSKMNASEVMTGRVVSVEGSANLMQAAAVMKENDVGFLGVSDEGQITGVVSDRDIVVRALGTGMDPSHTTVSEIKSGPAWNCRADMPVEECAGIMKEHKVRRLLVLDAESRPVGVLSLGDVASRAARGDLASDVMAVVAGELAAV
jgi:CBS domain-containing protein